MNYTTRSAFTKFTGVLVGASNMIGFWYPANIFSCSGLMMNTIAAGGWDVESTTLLLPDITWYQNKPLMWQYCWEIARRWWYSKNMAYTTTVNIGLCPWMRLSNVFLLTRQHASDGPKLSGMPFFVTNISYSINLDQQTWTTAIQGSQVTNFNLGPWVPPPCPAPN
jgi:hypothetical protein